MKRNKQDRGGHALMGFSQDLQCLKTEMRGLDRLHKVPPSTPFLHSALVPREDCSILNSGMFHSPEQNFPF
jgi:hypothetical protein